MDACLKAASMVPRPATSRPAARPLVRRSLILSGCGQTFSLGGLDSSLGLVGRRRQRPVSNTPTRSLEQAVPWTMNWLGKHYRAVARVLPWIGIVAIIILSVVPAKDRPVTDAKDWFGAWDGHLIEHVAAFAPVAAAFAIGYYRWPLKWLLLLALLFCGGIELLQVPLPTRHATVADFIVDLVASWLAIAIVFAGEMAFAKSQAISREGNEHN